MDLTEAEDIKKRWQEYTEELYKKDLHDPDNHDGVITHLEPDILECEVKWALESITTNKASEGDGIRVELFQILKDDAVKVLPSDALLQHLPSYLGFSYLGRGVSLHGCSSKAQPLLLTLDEGYLLTATLPDLQRGIAPLGPPAPGQPPLLGRGVVPPGRHPWPWVWVAPPCHRPWPKDAYSFKGKL